MEAYLRHGGLPPFYRCDESVNWTDERWLREGESHEIIGTCSLIFGVVCIVFHCFSLAYISVQALYIPCCFVFLQPDLRCVTAYKLLFLLSLFQICGLIQNAVLGGMFFIKGAVYCNYPHLNYIAGSTVMFGWSGVCMTCLILGVSRLIDLWSSVWHDAIFGGLKAIFWICIILAYSLCFLFYANPTVFNSKQLTWHFDPFVYPDGSQIMAYVCYITVLNNEGAVSLNLLLTVLFVGVFSFKSYRYNFKMSTSQKQIFIQYSVCNLNNLIGASIFVSYLFIDGGKVLNFIGFLAWLVSASSDLVMFLFINVTVRKRVLVLLGFRHRGVHSVHSHTAQQTARNSQYETR